MHPYPPSSPNEISTQGRQSTDGATSHPTKQPKDGCQVVGYVQQVERGIDTPDCPCIGHCSTVLGDDVCRGCRRTLDEVTRWPQLSEEERRAVNRRIALEQWEQSPP